ncbi:MAG: hypothetical protein IJ538_03435 [Clostridia bacterium]|nr:hypothetical protein [Clostridia bacterium]
MERERAEQIFEAIKKDNLKLFSSLLRVPADYEISFGRFPILSLCFLYESYNIISKYEKRLIGINKFEKVYEPFDAYKKFRKCAKKSIRIFSDEKIVEPLEMLSVLGENDLILAKYQKFHKNEEILQNSAKIYSLTHNEINDFTAGSASVKPKNLANKILSITASAIVALFIAIISVVSIFVNVTNGIGSSSNPIKIRNSSAFVTAIQNGGRDYVLEEDVIINEKFSSGNFYGKLDGNGHTVTLAENQVNLIAELTGSISNLKIKTSINNTKITENSAIIAKKNSGTILNVEISSTISAEIGSTEEGSETDFSIFTLENSGTISNCTATIYSTITNENHYDATFSVFATVNNGTILNVELLGQGIETDTVDVAAVSIQNNGTIKFARNMLNVSQTSASDSWNPNTAGIVVNNYGTIENSFNYGKISSTSTAATSAQTSSDSKIMVYSGGLVCMNFSSITSSKNFGTVKAIGNVGLAYAGGVVCQNHYYNNLPGAVEQCKSNAEISATSILSEAYSAGITAFNAGSILNCGVEGKIVGDGKVTTIAGGIVALGNANYSGLINNSYSSASFEEADIENDEDAIKFLGGIVGIVQKQVVYGQGSVDYPFLNNYYVSEVGFERSANASISYIYYTPFGTSVDRQNISLNDEDVSSTACANTDEIPSEVIIDD